MHRLLALVLSLISTRAYASAQAHEVFDGRFPQTVAIVVQTDFKSRPYVFCSGNLIGPQTVLTASHCIGNAHSDISAYLKIFDGDASDVSEPPYVPAQNLKNVTAIVRHPNEDFALVILQKPVTSILDPIRICDPNVIQAQPNQLIRSVGYGVNQKLGNEGIKRQFATTITVTNFNWLWAGQGLGQTICNGDSGGSAYLLGGLQGRSCLVAIANRVGIPNAAGNPEAVPELCGFLRYQSGYRVINSEVFNWIRESSPFPLF